MRYIKTLPYWHGKPHSPTASALAEEIAGPRPIFLVAAEVLLKLVVSTFRVKSFIFFLTALSVGALAFGTGAVAATPTGGADVAKSEKPDSIPRPNPGLPLKKGMTAQDVKERWGAPASVEPFPSAGGKAEVWTYFYTLSDQTTQVVTSTENQLTYAGPTEGMQNVPHLVYGTKRSEVKQVVKLLLYDGTLISWKKSVEREERLE